MTRRLALPLLLLVVALAAGCGSDDAPRQAATETAKARQLRAGAHVFAEHCRICHSLLGKPNTDIQVDALPLDLDQVQPSPAYVRSRLETGGVAMGGFNGVLSEAEMRDVQAYVLAVGGRDVIPPDGVTKAELSQGRALYDQHCQRCHKLAGREPTRPNPIWVATDFDVLRPSVPYVEQIVREGQWEAMPAFRDRLSWRQVRAVAIYVNAAARGGRVPLP